MPFWPDYRCYYKSSETSVIILNKQDHIEVESYGSNLQDALEEVLGIERAIGQDFEFQTDQEFGFICVSPFLSGSGVSLEAKISNAVRFHLNYIFCDLNIN